MPPSRRSLSGERRSLLPRAVHRTASSIPQLRSLGIRVPMRVARKDIEIRTFAEQHFSNPQVSDGSATPFCHALAMSAPPPDRVRIPQVGERRSVPRASFCVAKCRVFAPSQAASPIQDLTGQIACYQAASSSLVELGAFQRATWSRPNCLASYSGWAACRIRASAHKSSSSCDRM